MSLVCCLESTWIDGLVGADVYLFGWLLLRLRFGFARLVGSGFGPSVCCLVVGFVSCWRGGRLLILVSLLFPCCFRGLLLGDCVDWWVVLLYGCLSVGMLACLLDC